MLLLYFFFLFFFFAAFSSSNLLFVSSSSFLKGISFANLANCSFVFFWNSSSNPNSSYFATYTFISFTFSINTVNSFAHSGTMKGGSFFFFFFFGGGGAAFSMVIIVLIIIIITYSSSLDQLPQQQDTPLWGTPRTFAISPLLLNSDLSSQLNPLLLIHNNHQLNIS